jgi:hypothetical protein
MRKLEAKLSLRIVYSGDDAKVEIIRDVLQGMVEYAADRGLLTRDLDLVVEESDFAIVLSKAED